MRKLYVVLCPRSWREGIASVTTDGEPVELDIRTPSGCCGYLPVFETRRAAEAWSGGLFEVVEFLVVSAAPTTDPARVTC